MIRRQKLWGILWFFGVMLFLMMWLFNVRWRVAT